MVSSDSGKDKANPLPVREQIDKSTARVIGGEGYAGGGVGQFSQYACAELGGDLQG